MDSHNPEQDSGLLIVAALLAEARSLIDLFQLKAVTSTPLRLFTNHGTGKRSSANPFFNQRPVSLVVSGIGELAAATSTATALTRLGVQTIAINIGVAGAEQNLGDLFYASSIEKYGHSIVTGEESAVSRRSGFPVFYPHTPFRPLVPALRVATVEQPCTDYRPDVCYDMEAYGFCFAARRFLNSEQIHSLKIISDTPQSPLQNSHGNSQQQSVSQGEPGLSAKSVSSLIAAKIPEIESFARQLYEACDQQKPASCASSGPAENVRDLPLIAELLDRAEANTRKPIHFSVTERRQLKRLAERFEALECELPNQPSNSQIHTGREVIQLLEATIKQHLPVYGTVESKNPIPEKA